MGTSAMAQENQLSEDERYQYIGFETFGKKVPPFWKNEEERKEHLQEVHQQEGSVYRRSVVYSDVLSMADRVAVTIASLVMIVAPFLAWMKVETIYGPVAFTGFFGLMNLDKFWFYVEMMGGMIIPVSVYLIAAIAYLSLVFGVVTLVTLFLKAGSLESYTARLKRVLRLQIIPFLLFLVVVVLSFIGQRIPFGQHLGVWDLGSRYTVVTLVQFSSIGLWLAIFGFLLNFNKSKEL
jgi:hypothetical protein